MARSGRDGDRHAATRRPCVGAQYFGNILWSPMWRPPTCRRPASRNRLPATQGHPRPTQRRTFMDLKGAVALVTGGNGGLGQRICHALAREGAHIAVMYAQSRDQAEGVVHDLTSHYQINAAAFACDIIDKIAVDTLVGDVTALRASRHPDQRRRLQQIGTVPRPRQSHRGAVGEDHGGEPHWPTRIDQGGGADQRRRRAGAASSTSPRSPGSARPARRSPARCRRRG